MHWAVVAGKAGIGEKAGETVISGRQGPVATARCGVNRFFHGFSLEEARFAQPQWCVSR